MWRHPWVGFHAIILISCESFGEHCLQVGTLLNVINSRGFRTLRPGMVSGWLPEMQSFIHLFTVVQLFSHVWLFETLWTAACQASLPFTISQSLLKLMSIESVMPSNHNILCLPLLLLPSICPSIRGFSNESALHTMCVAKVLELQLQHQSFQWIFRVDLLKNWLVWSPCCPRDSQESSPAPQLESVNSLVLRLLYAPNLMYTTTGKTIALTIWTFFSEVMSLLHAIRDYWSPSLNHWRYNDEQNRVVQALLRDINSGQMHK